MNLNINSSKNIIIQKLKEHNLRITKQREILIDIILAGKYSCSKEIYYEASKVDNSIGLATVYRFIATLEELGIIDKNSRFNISECCLSGCDCRKVVVEDLILSDENARELHSIVEKFLKEKGIITNENFSVSITQFLVFHLPL